MEQTTSDTLAIVSTNALFSHPAQIGASRPDQARCVFIKLSIIVAHNSSVVYVEDYVNST